VIPAPYIKNIPKGYIMSILQSLILGLLQGITEFLPISSSGHLVLAEAAFNLKVESLKSFDVLLHVGSLIGIIVFFRKRILEILLKDRKHIGYLIVGTIPAVIAGFTLEDTIDSVFRGVLPIGIAMMATGVFYLIAERFKLKDKNINAKNSFIIGLAQMCALIPGISRSGSTLATGLLTGIERTKAAEFSFLLGSIAITGAGILQVKDIGELPAVSVSVVGALVSAVTSYFVIGFLMKFYKNNTLKPFAYYLFLIGMIAIALFIDIKYFTPF